MNVFFYRIRGLLCDRHDSSVISVTQRAKVLKANSLLIGRSFICFVCTVGVVNRSAERYDLLKIKLTE